MNENKDQASFKGSPDSRMPQSGPAAEGIAGGPAKVQGPGAMRHGLTGRHAAVHSRTATQAHAKVVTGNPRLQNKGRRLSGEKIGKHSADISQLRSGTGTNNPREIARANAEAKSGAKAGAKVGAHASAPLGAHASADIAPQGAGRDGTPRSNNPREEAALRGAHGAHSAQAEGGQGASKQSHNPRLAHGKAAAGDNAAMDLSIDETSEAANQGFDPFEDEAMPLNDAQAASGVQVLRGNPRAGGAVGLAAAGASGGAGVAGEGAQGFVSVMDSAVQRGSNGGDFVGQFSPEFNMSASKGKRSKRKKILIACLCVLLVAVLGGAGAVYAYMMSIQSTLQEGVTEGTLDVLDSSMPISDPFYMLLMGTDGSMERDASGDFGDSYRTDSMMLLRIDPKEKKVACVSIMRDLQIDLGRYGTQKINAAHAFGGTALAIETVSDLADVPIAHFAEINFDGFKEIIDALGGVEVDVPIEINDPDAGGHLNSGLQTLNGDQALILCRSRYAFEELGSGDIYRAANQRIVIAAIVKKLLSSDLPTMIETISKMAEYVTTDLSITDIINLATSMRGMNMDEDFYTAVTPTTSDYSGGIWWEILDEDAWEDMMDRMFNGLPPLEETEIDEVTGMVMGNAGDGGSADAQIQRRKRNHSGTVSVKNGCGVAGVGAEVAALVEALGFTATASNANNANYTQTIVVYDKDDQRQDAQDIATELGGIPVVKNNNEYIYDADFLVVVGADWVE